MKCSNYLLLSALHGTAGLSFLIAAAGCVMTADKEPGDWIIAALSLVFALISLFTAVRNLRAASTKNWGPARQR